MSRASDPRRLPAMLDDLIARAAMDAEDGREDCSPATNSIRNTIIERYGKVDDAIESDPMPVFVIKAKDRLATSAVVYYEGLCKSSGLAEQAAEVHKALKEISAWRSRHPERVQAPDHKHVPAKGDQQ